MGNFNLFSYISPFYAHSSLCDIPVFLTSHILIDGSSINGTAQSITCWMCGNWKCTKPKIYCLLKKTGVSFMSAFLFCFTLLPHDLLLVLIVVTLESVQLFTESLVPVSLLEHKWDMRLIERVPTLIETTKNYWKCFLKALSDGACQLLSQLSCPNVKTDCQYYLESQISLCSESQRLYLIWSCISKSQYLLVLV